jgi:hypothetical protein
MFTLEKDIVVLIASSMFILGLPTSSRFPLDLFPW